jgi:hypothetical protein
VSRLDIALPLGAELPKVLPNNHTIITHIYLFLLHNIPGAVSVGQIISEIDIMN